MFPLGVYLWMGMTCYLHIPSSDLPSSQCQGFPLTENYTSEGAQCYNYIRLFRGPRTSSEGHITIMMYKANEKGARENYQILWGSVHYFCQIG